MPGPYIHMSAARAAAAGVEDGWAPTPSERVDPASPGPNLADLASMMQGHPNYTSMGAVGPDLFFFLPDFRDIGDVALSSVLVEVLDFLEGVYDALDPYVSKYEKYLGPISEDSAEEMSRLTGGLSESVGNITGELSGILITALEDFAVGQRDWWEFFSLGLNRGYDEQAYLWSDMLHYRQTGEFATALLRSAESTGDEALQAYALGYLTHVATDTVAHGFVNQVAGGPFRLHWQRHHLVENHADAHWYATDPEAMAPRLLGSYNQLTESALYYDIAFDETDMGPVPRPSLPAGHSMRDNWVRKRLLDIDSELPEDLAALLIETMTAVFYGPGGKHPNILRMDDGRPNVDLVQESYRLLWRYLKLSTVDGFNHEVPPPPDVFPNLDFPTPSDPAGDDPPGDGDGGNLWDDLLDFILAVVNVLAYIAEVAVYLATLPWAILADLVTYPLRLGLYYALELPLFYLLKSFRAVLVRTAYLMPMADEVDPTLITVGNALDTSWLDVVGDLGDVFGGQLGGGKDRKPKVALRDPMYPYVHHAEEFKHPWQYPSPTTPTELCPTTAGPHPRGASSDVLFRTTDASPEVRDGLENAATPVEADQVGCTIGPGAHLGDVVTMSRYLMWQASRTPPDADTDDPTPAPVVDWQMDSDRGYGYHCWDWNRDEKAAPVSDQATLLLPFQPPCTWPSQTQPSTVDNRGYTPTTRMQTHWAGPGLEDPGCHEPECVSCDEPPPIG